MSDHTNVELQVFHEGEVVAHKFIALCMSPSADGSLLYFPILVSILLFGYHIKPNELLNVVSYGIQTISGESWAELELMKDKPDLSEYFVFSFLEEVNDAVFNHCNNLASALSMDLSEDTE